MSTWDDFLNAGGQEGGAANASAKTPSTWDNFVQGLATLGEGALHTLPSVIGYVGDLANDAPAIVAPGTLGTVTGGPVHMPGYGPASEAVGKSFNEAEEAAAKQANIEQPGSGEIPHPHNSWQQFLNTIGQGLGAGIVGAPMVPELAGRAVVSGITGALSAYGAQKAGGGEVAQTVAGLVGGGLPFIGAHGAAITPHEAGAMHPDFNTLAHEVVPALEAGGTLENPKTNPKSGAFGPMQVTPDTLRQPGYGIKPWDGTVEDSVRIGQQKLGALLHRYDGDVDKTLAAYNWGEGNLDHALEKYGAEWLNHVPEETFNYVQRGQRLLGGTDTMGSTGGPVPPMEPEDIEAAMGGPDDEQILSEIGKEPEGEDDTAKFRDVLQRQAETNALIDSHLGEAHAAIDDIRDGFDPDLEPHEVANYQQGIQEVLDGMDPNHPLRDKALYAQQLWQQVQDAMDQGKPPVDNTLPNASVAKVMGEPKEVEAANDGFEDSRLTDTERDRIIRELSGAATNKRDVENSADKYVTYGSKEPTSGGRGGGSGMGGDFGNGGEEPPAEGEPKYADSVNLNRIKISQDAKQLIKDQLLPANLDIETHEENKVKAMSYIDRHGVDNILSGFHKVEPDELSAYQTAVRALSAASKQNVADLARQFPDERTRNPEQADQIRNAIEMSGRATTLDNIVAKQLGRSMSARRIYMGGNSALRELLNGAHLDDDSLNKLVDKINAMPSQAGDIAADAMKPGWLDYVKSAYYGISLLSRLSTPIGIFASVSVSHMTEALVHTVGHMIANPLEPRAYASWLQGWAKGFEKVPENVKKAWAQGIPTDKASLLQSRVNLPGILGFPSKLIASTDEFFGTLGRSAKAYSDAAQRAYSEGFRGDRFSARVSELVKNMTPEEQKIVEDYGKFARLQDSPTPLGRLFKAAVNNKNPMISLPATIVLPFVNIADRLFMYSVRMTPGLSFTDRITQRDFASSPTGKAVAIGRQLVGAGLASYAVTQVLNGNMTGQGPGDPGKKAQWLANHQADSIKIGDHWVSYARLPFSSLLSAAATAVERYQETGDGKGYMKTIEGMFIGASSGMLHSHYLEGVANFADSMSSGSPDKLEDFLGRTVRSFIPGIEQSINEAVIDPTVRDTKGSPFLDNIKAGLIGESQTLPAKHDVYGRTQTYQGGAARLVNPFPEKHISSDPTISALDNLNAHTPTSVVTAAAKTIHLNGQPVKLSETGYQKYQALSGQLFRQAMAGNDLSGMQTADRVKFVKKTLSDARREAKAQLWGDL